MQQHKTKLVGDFIDLLIKIHQLDHTFSFANLYNAIIRFAKDVNNKNKGIKIADKLGDIAYNHSFIFTLPMIGWCLLFFEDPNSKEGTEYDYCFVKRRILLSEDFYDLTGYYVSYMINQDMSIYGIISLDRERYINMLDPSYNQTNDRFISGYTDDLLDEIYDVAHSRSFDDDTNELVHSVTICKSSDLLCSNKNDDDTQESDS